MNTIIIDSASDRLYILLLKNNRVISANCDADRMLHSGIINRKIAEILEICPLSEIGAIAVNVGPGSFTGIRVGIATAYGLSAPCGIKLVEVSTHEILSFCAAKEVKTFVPANRGQYYYATMKRGAFITEPQMIDCGMYEELSKAQSVVHSPRDYTKELSAAVRRKIKENRFVDRFTPLYVQKSQAEINLAGAE